METTGIAMKSVHACKSVYVMVKTNMKINAVIFKKKQSAKLMLKFSGYNFITEQSVKANEKSYIKTNMH